jgi:hypothetical protein
MLSNLVIPSQLQGNSTTFRISKLTLDDLLVVEELLSVGVGVEFENSDAVGEPWLEEIIGASRGYMFRG